MKSRILGFVIVAAVAAAIGVQQAQVAALREEVAQLRASIQGRASSATPRLIPIQGQLTTPAPTAVAPRSGGMLPAKPRSPFRLIESGSEGVERGMKADEFEMRRRQQEWFERQQNPHRLEAPQRDLPPWTQSETPDMR